MKAIFFLLAMSGVFYNDILALVSVAGASLLLLGAYLGPRYKRLIDLGEWSLAPVFFGILFQSAMLLTELTPDRIGFVLPMPPLVIDGLFGLACLFLLGFLWLRLSPRLRQPAAGHNEPEWRMGQKS